MPQIITERMERWAKFLAGDTDRRTMVILTHNYDPVRPLLYPEYTAQRVDWMTEAYYRNLERAQWLDDDAVPGILTYTGTELFAAAFGCPVHYPGNNTPFARPLLFDPADVKTLRMPTLENEHIDRAFELARRVRDRVGKDAPVMLPDIQSPVDIAALIMEKSVFLLSMLEEPEAVSDLTAMTEEFLTTFLDAWFREFGTDYLAHFPAFPMRGGFTFSEDEVGEFGAPLFEKFCLPGINRLSRRYGGCAMHCCAYSRHQWEMFRRIEGLRLLNLVQPDDVMAQAWKVFGDRLCYYFHVALDETPRTFIPRWARAVGPEARIVIEKSADSREEAVELLKRIREFAYEREEQRKAQEKEQI